MAPSVERSIAEYERAYRDSSADVFRFLLAWTNDWSAAQDLTQETFIRLWTHRTSVDWERPILGWLLVTARRLASNRFRTLRRRLWMPASTPTSEEHIRAEWLDVRAALGSLSSLERSALILTSVEGWSYTDLAQVMNTSDGALRAAVSRARAKLAEA